MASRFVASIPVLGALTAVTTVGIAYKMTMDHRQLPEYAVTPPISLLGCQNPARSVYMYGFLATAVMFLIGVQVVRINLISKMAGDMDHAHLFAILAGLACVVGIGGQGIIPLQEDFISSVVVKGEPSNAQSWLHQYLALIFFVAALIHSACAIYIYQYSTSPLAVTLRVSKYVKCALFLVPFVFSYAANRYHPAVVPGAHYINVAGLSQYVSVLAHILFFATYTYDLHIVIDRTRAALAKQKKAR